VLLFCFRRPIGTAAGWSR